MYNGEKYLTLFFKALHQSKYTNYELIAIDDCSTDKSYDILQKNKPDILLKNTNNIDSASSRNLAASYATGEVLVFLDQDIIVKPDTLSHFANHFTSNSIYCAVIGVYTLEHPNTNIYSLYKNTWIRFSYLSAGKDIKWFFSAIGAIRKSVWDKNVRFQESYKNSIHPGDIEFGQSLVRNGYRIHLDPDIEVTHMKHFTFSNLLRNNLLRAYGFTQSFLNNRFNLFSSNWNGYANVSIRFILSIPIALCFICILFLSFFDHKLYFAAICLLAGYIFCNQKFLQYIATHFSLGFTIKTCFILILDHLVCGIGVCAALANRLMKKLNIKTT